MLTAVYSVFNEAEFLEKSLLSIKDKVDRIYVVDGAYRKFPHNDFCSTDGTIEIAHKYVNELVVFGKEWSSEIAKRNQYLSMVKNGDVCLVIDGHEIWQGELKPPFGNYRIRMKMKDGWHSFPRMFIKQKGLKYRKHHYQLWLGKQELNMEWPEYPYGYLIHEDIADQKRIIQKEKFYSMSGFDR